MLNIWLWYDTAITLLDVYPENWKQACTETCTYSIVYNSQKVEASEMFNSLWMGKYNVVYPYGGILFGNKKEWSIVMGYSTDEP